MADHYDPTTGLFTRPDGSQYRSSYDAGLPSAQNYSSAGAGGMYAGGGKTTVTEVPGASAPAAQSAPAASAPAPAAAAPPPTATPTAVSAATPSPMTSLTNVINGAQDPAKGWQADAAEGEGQGGLGTRSMPHPVDVLRKIVNQRGRVY